MELPPQYDPKSVEKAMYQKWLDAKVFHSVPDERPADKRFSMVIPPPNVTGALHLGHAINGTLQDILARYHRMKGDNTLWMPGIDHAGIATQAVVEKTIFEKEKKTRHDLGREELVRRIWEWKEQFGTRILSQLASIGASCDWDRTRFTLDEICARAVREAFFKMFKDGLIFRGKRLVNWDTHLQTAVADDEIYHETVRGQLTSIKYPVEKDERRKTKDESEGMEYLVVATTRPETMLGDTAVAVHPEDPRYQHLIGKFVILPLVGRRIPVIADGLLVDPKFGTGVVKVTPAHDPNDYATGLRHNLEQINLLTADGKVNEHGAGEFLGRKYSYVGLKFATAARKAVLEDLEGLGLIVEKKVHEHEVGHSDRSKTPIEPYLSDQWFVKMGDIDGQDAEPRPSGSDEFHKHSGGSLPHGRGSDAPPHSDALAYFITFHTFATWLHGQEPGAVDPEHNTYDSPFIPPDPKLLQIKLANLEKPPIELDVAQRQSVLATLFEVAHHRGWKIHAANVRSTHVHIVVSGNQAPERMMNDFKSYATRRMVESSLLPAGVKAWSRHGSTRYLWKTEHLEGAVHYTLHEQGENPPGTAAASRTAPREGHAPDRALVGSLPNGRGSEAGRGSDGRSGITLADGTRSTGLAQAAMDAVTSGRVRITPERYAKGYLDWLGQKRDWCISRQLWWGHRIPVWSRHFDSKEQWWGAPGTEQDGVQDTLISLSQNGSISIWYLSDMGESFSDKWPDVGAFTAFVCTPGDVVPTWLAGVGDDYDPAPTLKAARDKLIESMKASKEHQAMLEMLGQSAEEMVQNAIEAAEDSKQLVRELARDPQNRSMNVRALLDQAGFVQDPDVLDTWFSSALWPISTMGWPAKGTSDKPEDQLLSYFYPTSVLSTAREILTLWVARMVMFGLYCHGDVPFRDVYIHAVIQDGEGRPMKKSLGNGVDPVDIAESHGADALRFTLASMATETQDIRMPVTKDAKTGKNTSPKFDIGRNFANKIWNASRFILSMPSPTKQGAAADAPAPTTLAKGELADRWIMSRLNATVAAVHSTINEFRFADYATAVYQFFWSDLCDWYLEVAKARIKAQEPTVHSVLRHCLATSLQLLHPMMPFITEKLWEYLAGNGTMLVTQSFPHVFDSLNDPAAESQMQVVQSVTSAIREIQNRYPAAKGKEVILQPRDSAMQAVLEKSRAIIEPLANVKIAENSPTAPKPDNAAAALVEGVQIFIGGVIDKNVERAKLEKRKAELAKHILSSRNKLGNEAFVSKAPANIIQGLRDQLARQEEEAAAIEKNLVELQN